MKKFAILMLSGALLLSASLLTAQPAYSPYPAGGYSSTNNTSYNQAPLNQINWLRSYAEAVALSQSSSKPIIILFTGTGWCPACMRLEREVLTRPEFAQAVGQKFVFLKADFPDYTESSVMTSPFKPLIDRYGINLFPTLVVVNATGQQLYKMNYREGGPQVYATELLQILNQSASSNSMNANMNYYK